MQLWPIQMFINELPPKQRLSSKNLLLPALWCSTKKAPPVTVLKSLLSEAVLLEAEGVRATVPCVGDVTCRVKILSCIADLPAKAALLNCTQYNGQYGCHTCKHEGQQVKAGRGSTRVYTFMDADIRSQEEHLQHASLAETSSKPQFGVKEKSVMFSLPGFDVIRSFPVDYMHCVLLGVVRRLLSLWFGSSHHRKDWYIGKKHHEVNKNMSAIKAPLSISRLPENIQKGSSWKASQCRTFLLYYLPSTLHGILPDKYLAHALILSKAIRMLTDSCISTEELAVAERLLQLFSRLTESYYGPEQCTMNVHLLNHLPMYVKLYGPLWTHSAFSFEDGMGCLVRRAHGTHDIGHQVMTAYLLQWRMNYRTKMMVQSPTCPIEVKHLTETFTVGHRRSLATKVCPTFDVIGCTKQIALDEPSSQSLQRMSIAVGLDVEYHPLMPAITYPKVIVNGQLFVSSDGSRSKKRNSATVTFTDPQQPDKVSFGAVQKFLTVENKDHPEKTVHVALILPMNVASCTALQQMEFPDEINSLKSLPFSDYVSVTGYQNVLAVAITDLTMMCFDVSTPTKSILLKELDSR